MLREASSLALDLVAPMTPALLGVVDLAGVSHQADHARHVDDRARLLPDHLARDGLGEVEDALQIDRYHQVPVLLAHGQEEPVARDARVVDQNVHATKMLDDLGRHLLDRLGVRHVDLVGLGFDSELSEARGSLLRFLQVDIDRRDRGAFCCQTLGNGGADALRCSGDQRDLLVQQSHVLLSRLPGLSEGVGACVRVASVVKLGPGSCFLVRSDGQLDVRLETVQPALSCMTPSKSASTESFIPLESTTSAPGPATP
jgi:hypothetical protein